MNQDAPPSGKFPVGMTLLCMYIGYSLLMKLWGLRTPMMIVGPLVLGKLVVVSYDLISAIILSICLIGILKKQRWARTMVLGWFGFWIVFILFDFFLTFAYKTEVVDLYQQMMPQQSGLSEFTIMLGKLMGVGLILIINSIVCWYVYSKREFFAR